MLHVHLLFNVGLVLQKADANIIFVKHDLSSYSLGNKLYSSTVISNLKLEIVFNLECILANMLTMDITVSQK